MVKFQILSRQSALNCEFQLIHLVDDQRLVNPTCVLNKVASVSGWEPQAAPSIPVRMWGPAEPVPAACLPCVS